MALTCDPNNPGAFYYNSYTKVPDPVEYELHVNGDSIYRIEIHSGKTWYIGKVYDDKNVMWRKEWREVWEEDRP